VTSVHSGLFGVLAVGGAQMNELIVTATPLLPT
jgi:hypothetical protein